MSVPRVTPQSVSVMLCNAIGTSSAVEEIKKSCCKLLKKSLLSSAGQELVKHQVVWLLSLVKQHR